MSKRRVGLFAALIAAVAALLFISSGCGGGATKSGGLEKLDGPAILEKAKTAAAAKKSVHIHIKQVESGATSVIDVGFADGASGGTFDTPEAKFSFTMMVLSTVIASPPKACSARPARGPEMASPPLGTFTR